MSFAHLATIEEMSEEDCRSHLAAGRLGRLAVQAGDHPEIFPVSYVFDGTSIIFRTEPGTKLSAASMAKVAFEIDEVDRTAGTGWSVMAKGTAFDVTDSIDPASQAARTTPIDSPVAADDAHWVRISRLVLSGRHLELLTPAGSESPSEPGSTPAG
jgi:nitroimidazol reductase NimA-like FMN-containing flavoprotein (pyridoxamine 5'-phosphate oxidase superfamily)